MYYRISLLFLHSTIVLFPAVVMVDIMKLHPARYLIVGGLRSMSFCDEKLH